MKDQWRGSILVIISAVSYGFQPIFTRLAYASGIEIKELLLFSLLFSALITGAYLGLAGKLASPTKQQFLHLSLLGAVAFSVFSALYYLALQFIPVSIAVLIFYTYPAFVTVASAALGWERVSKLLVIALALAFSGLIMVIDPVFDVGMVGLLLSLGSSLAYTIYVMGSSRILRELSGEVTTFYILIFAAVGVGAATIFTGGIQVTWDFDGWLWLILMSLISTSMAMVAFFKGMKLIGASKGSIISILEVITSVIIAAMLFQEILLSLQLVGAILILFAALLAALSKPRK